jgi:hypothetical protein
MNTMLSVGSQRYHLPRGSSLLGDRKQVIVDVRFIAYNMNPNNTTDDSRVSSGSGADVDVGAVLAVYRATVLSGMPVLTASELSSLRLRAVHGSCLQLLLCLVLWLPNRPYGAATEAMCRRQSSCPNCSCFEG